MSKVPSRRSYRCCFVPKCKNTTKNTVDRIFFCVPNNNEKMKKLWFKVAGRKDTPSRSNFFCCQDHFEIKNDMENYVRYSLTGGPIKLKPNVLPHIFDCQTDREMGESSRVTRSFASKRRRLSSVSHANEIPSDTMLDFQENKENSAHVIANNDRETSTNTVQMLPNFDFNDSSEESDIKPSVDPLLQPGCSSWSDDTCDIDIKHEKIEIDARSVKTEMLGLDEENVLLKGTNFLRQEEHLLPDDENPQRKGISLSPYEVNFQLKKENLPTHDFDPLRREENPLLKGENLSPHEENHPMQEFHLPPYEENLPPKEENLILRVEIHPQQERDFPLQGENLTPQVVYLPSHEEDLPLEKENLALEGEDLLPHVENLPQRENVPLREIYLPLLEEDLSQGPNVPQQGENVPPQELTYHFEEDLPPQGQNVPPQELTYHFEEDLPPQGQNVPPQELTYHFEEHLPPQGQNVPPKEENVPPQELTYHYEEDLPPQGQNVPPQKDNVPPQEVYLPLHEEDPPLPMEDLSPQGEDVPQLKEILTEQEENLLLEEKNPSRQEKKVPRHNKKLSPHNRNIAKHKKNLSPHKKIFQLSRKNVAPPIIAKKYVNRGIQCTAVGGRNVRSVKTNCNLSSSDKKAKISFDASTSKRDAFSSMETQQESTPCDGVYSSPGLISTNEKRDDATDDQSEDVDQPQIQKKRITLINYMVRRNCKDYIGISHDLFWIIELLKHHTKMTTDHLKMTLMKIKLDDDFRRLGIQFGLSAVQAERAFNRTVVQLSNCLQAFICFPPQAKIKKLLPIPFRANYSNVGAMVECLEIEIEKPSDLLEQGFTWSETKKCNTIKYLVSATPDGTINYISSGYGGKISSSSLLENCGILEKLPENVDIMANREFQSSKNTLDKRKMHFFPSAATSTKSLNHDISDTINSSCLRIYIDRVIKRLREYKILEPHACVHRKVLPFMDFIVVITAALVNMQSPVIKT